MAAVCQFYQHGHCKFTDSCDKIHNSMTCDSFPCLDNTCSKRHPRRCRYYDMYGRCRFAERCSFLHYDGGDRVESEGYKAVMEDVVKLREEIETLRIENIRLIEKVEAQSRDQFTRLLEMIKDIKEEIDVNRVVSGYDDHSVEKVYSNSSVTCQVFPCLDLSCVEHYTEEGHARCYNPAKTGVGRRGDRTGTKMKKGKQAAPEMLSSLSRNGTPGGNIGHGRGQN